MANATIVLTQGEKTVKTLTTDANGIFMARVPQGTYEVSVTWEQEGTIYTRRTELNASTAFGDIDLKEIVLEPVQPEEAE